MQQQSCCLREIESTIRDERISERLRGFAPVRIRVLLRPRCVLGKIERYATGGGSGALAVPATRYPLPL